MSFAGAFALLVALAAFALAIMTAMAFFFAHVTGWRRLARRHPAPPRFTGPRYRVDGAILGAWGWNAPPLSVGIDDAGLHLRALAPFGLTFRPIRLPWSAIESVAHREMLLFELLELRFAAGRSGTIGLVGPSALMRAIEEHCPRPEDGSGLLTPSVV